MINERDSMVNVVHWCFTEGVFYFKCLILGGLAS